ncbi:MAG: hypothetical protein AABW51_04880 [Nanoarchaeota archaeon]
MRISYVRRLVKLVEESDVDSFEYSFSPFGLKINTLKIENRRDSQKTIEHLAQIAERKPEPSVSVEPKFIIVKESHGRVTLKSPEVATFYWREDKSEVAYPLRDTLRSFLKRRRHIGVGDILGYYEYLNHMFKIKAPCSGEIIRTYVRDKMSIEYNQLLFKIKVKK